LRALALGGGALGAPGGTTPLTVPPVVAPGSGGGPATHHNYHVLQAPDTGRTGDARTTMAYIEQEMRRHGRSGRKRRR